MIKSLLEADEETTKTETTVSAESSPEVSPDPNIAEARPVFELPGDSRFFKKSAALTPEDPAISSAVAPDSPAWPVSPEIMAAEPISATEVPPDPVVDTGAAEPFFTLADDEPHGKMVEDDESVGPKSEKSDDIFGSSSGTLFKNDPPPQPVAETIRQSGLAYTAAMVLFGAVVFMMLIGWFADLLIGSSPWGIVGGIILGGVVGFVQFFRIASQIFRK